MYSLVLLLLSRIFLRPLWVVYWFCFIFTSILLYGNADLLHLFMNIWVVSSFWQL